MSNTLDREYAHADEFSSIEQMIRDAKEYVVPSDDLRPRALEAARDAYEVKRAERNLGGFVLTSVCFCLLSLPVVDWLIVWRTQHSAPSAKEMEFRAMQMPQVPDSNPSWNLMQAFEQLRQVQATRLNVGR